MKSILRLALACGLTLAACSEQPFTIDVPFRVTSVTPSPGGRGIARRPEIVVTFSEDIDPASVKSSDNFKVEVIKDGAPTLVAGTYAYGEKGASPYAASFRPNQSLPWGTTIRLTLTTGVKRARDGASLPTPLSFEFETESPPQLAVANVRLDPPDSRDTNVVVTFTEPVKCATLETVKIVEHFDAKIALVRGAASRPVAGRWTCEQVSAGDSFNCAGGDCSYRFEVTRASNDTSDYDWSSRLQVAFEDDDASVRVQSARGSVLESLPGGTTYNLTLPNPTPFRLISTSHRPGTTPLSPGETVELVFNDLPVCSLSGLAGAVSSKSGEWFCPSANDCVDGRCTVGFKPAGLNFGDTLELRLAGGRWSQGSSLVSSVASTSVAGTLPETTVLEFRVARPEGMYVVSTSPSHGATNVALDSNITFKFTRPVREASVVLCDGTNASTCSLTVDAQADGAPSRTSVAGALSFDANENSFTFAPASPFAPSSAITATIKAEKLEAQDRALLHQTFELGFTARDPAEFTLLSALPAHGAQGVSQTQRLEFRFSATPSCDATAGVRGASVVASLPGGQPNPVPGTWTCATPSTCTQEAGCAVYFDASSPFALSSTVLTTFEADETRAEGATSRSGKLKRTAAVSFGVKAPDPLVLLSTSPAADATGVALKPTITLQFSRAVDCDSFTDNVQFSPNDTTWTRTCNPDSATVTYGRTADLARSQTVSVSLNTNIRARDSGALSAAATFSFRTLDPEPLRVVDIQTSQTGSQTKVTVEFDQTLATSPCTATLSPNVTPAPSVSCSQKKLTLTSSSLTPDTDYTMTIPTSIKSAAAVTVGGVTYGRLEKEVKYNFRTAPAIRLVDWSPTTTIRTAGAQIALTFNVPIERSSVVPCTAYETPQNCNLTVTKTPLSGEKPTVSAAIQASSNKLVFNLSALVPGATYTVTLSPTSQGPTSSTTSFPFQSVPPFTFTTQAAATMTQLPTSQTSVPVTSKVCGVFSDTVVRSTVDGSFELDSPLALDPTQPFIVDDKTVCLNLRPKMHGLLPFLLNYSTEYTITVKKSLQFVNLEPMTQNQLIQFTTEAAPTVAITPSFSNNVLTETPFSASNNLDIPWNARIKLAFGTPIDPASVNSASVRLVALAGETAIPLSLSTTTTEVTLVPLAELAPDTTYRLEVLGGAHGVLLADERPLGQTWSHDFSTSAVTTLALASPHAGVELPNGGRVELIASRKLHAPSFGPNVARATCENRKFTSALVNDRFIQFQMNARNDELADTCTFETTSQLRDERGNPVPDVLVMLEVGGGAPAPDAPTTLDHTALTIDCSNNEQACATLTFADNASKNRMLPSSFAQAIELKKFTTGGGSSTVPTSFRFIPGDAASPDALEIYAPTVTSGSYSLRIKQSDFRNLFGEAPSTTDCNSPGAPTPSNIISSGPCVSGVEPGLPFTIP